jgi:hypothetical protein
MLALSQGLALWQGLVLLQGLVFQNFLFQGFCHLGNWHFLPKSV